MTVSVYPPDCWSFDSQTYCDGTSLWVRVSCRNSGFGLLCSDSRSRWMLCVFVCLYIHFLFRVLWAVGTLWMWRSLCVLLIEITLLEFILWLSLCAVCWTSLARWRKGTSFGRRSLIMAPRWEWTTEPAERGDSELVWSGCAESV